MGFLDSLGFMGQYNLVSGILGLVSRSRRPSIETMTYSHAQEIRRIDARIEGERLVRAARTNSLRVASEAAALLSGASIDVGSGTASKIVQQSLIEAEREVWRIMRTTV